MINPFKIKKYGAFLLLGLFTCICFFIGLRFFSLMYALIVMLIGLIISTLVANQLIKTPFRELGEGNGVLVMNLDSTGVLRFSILGIRSPYVFGKMGKEKISDVWDRSTVLNISTPHKNGSSIEYVQSGPNRGGVRFELDEKSLNESRFGFFHWPVLIWNDQIKSLVTKDFLAEKEKGTFAEHGVLFLNRRVEELTTQIRDFARYVVETTKPKQSIFKNKWVVIIIIVFVVILIILFLPSIISTFKGVYGTASGATKSAFSSTAPITPR